MHNLNDNKGETYFLVFLNVKSSQVRFFVKIYHEHRMKNYR